jgi:hypothetical protein
MVNSSSFATGQRVHQWGVGGGNVINHIAQIFTIADGLVGLIGSHFSSLQEFFKD